MDNTIDLEFQKQDLRERAIGEITKYVQAHKKENKPVRFSSEEPIVWGGSPTSQLVVSELTETEIGIAMYIGGKIMAHVQLSTLPTDMLIDLAMEAETSLEELESAKKMIGKTIVLATSPYFKVIGKQALVKDADVNENRHIILCLDIPHPEDENTFLWVNIDEIAQ